VNLGGPSAPRLADGRWSVFLTRPYRRDGL
jgi:hypothetical protein